MQICHVESLFQEDQPFEGEVVAGVVGCKAAVEAGRQMWKSCFLLLPSGDRRRAGCSRKSR